MNVLGTKASKATTVAAACLAMLLIFPTAAFAVDGIEEPATTDSSAVTEAGPSSEEAAPAPAPEPAPAPAAEPAPEAVPAPEPEKEDSAPADPVTEDQLVEEAGKSAAPTSKVAVQTATDNTNDPKYWENLYPNAVACYKHDGNGGDHGTVTNNGNAVTLSPYGATWPGDRYEVLIVKGGSVDYGDGPGNKVYELPVAGTAYFAPLNAGGQQAAVSHWIICKGEAPVVEVPKPVVTLTGVSECVSSNGTYSVVWTVTITGNGTLDEVDLKVITHLPAGSLINGVDAQVWLTEWEEHHANNNLPAFPEGGVVTFTQTNIPGSATSATAGIQYDFENGPTGDPETTITLGGNCTPPPPTPKVCVTLENAPVATPANPAGWNKHDTRTTGVSDYVVGGYLLKTTDTDNPASGQNKATLYKSVTPTPMADFGEPSVEFADGGSGVKPGMQVGIDVDGDGDWDGYLVGEPWSYGAHNWWVNKPGFNVPSGMGYTSFGSWADFVAANPNAKVIEIGLSLGSGVIGNWTVKSFTANCIVYTFDKPKVVVAPAPTGSVTSGCLEAPETGAYAVVEAENPMPTGENTETTAVDLTLVVDGESSVLTLNPGEGFISEILFDEDSGTHSVQLLYGETVLAEDTDIRSDCAENLVSGNPDAKAVKDCGSVTYTFTYPAVELGENDFTDPETFVYTDANGDVQEVIMEAGDEPVTKTVEYAEDANGGEVTVEYGVKGQELTSITIDTNCVEPPVVKTPPSGGVQTDAGPYQAAMNYMSQLSLPMQILVVAMALLALAALLGAATVGVVGLYRRNKTATYPTA